MKHMIYPAKIGILSKLLLCDTGKKLADTPQENISYLLDDIKNNLQCILNYKQNTKHNRLQYPMLEDSILNYGLPDLSQYNPVAKEDRQKICNIMQVTIQRFEKRLNNIRVIDNWQNYPTPNITLHFEIIAHCRFLSDRVPIAFASILKAQDEIHIDPARFLSK